MFSGEKIRFFRLKCGKTQQELSNATGIPLRTIQNWEKGISKPLSIKDINSISIELGCYLDDLCEDGKDITNLYEIRVVYNTLINYSKLQESNEKKQLAFSICKKLEVYI